MAIDKETIWVVGPYRRAHCGHRRICYRNFCHSSHAGRKNSNPSCRSWNPLVLAIIEGLTEFLPVSSNGHMIIASSVMGIAADPFTKTFTVAIQLGAILSVIVLYWKRFLPQRGIASASFHFYLKLFTAFLPAAILGFLLNDFIDQLLERVEVVAILLILGGLVFLFIDKLFPIQRRIGKRPKFHIHPLSK